MENVDISFARKYRPNTLDGYIGNEGIKERVRNIMSSGKRPQSILLTGNTGCGKTTLSRIIESWYMCESPSDDGSPCGVCPTCELMKSYIETGNSEDLPDIKEIDVTDKSGKSDMDIILEEVSYPAFNGGWKVYMFDECHKMSDAASNRILKTLEEPPEKVLLIFCTTDPQKMLDTVKNRCQLKLEVSKPKTSELCKLLARVCRDVGKDYDTEGLRMIVTRANRVIRDSLNYLETVISSRGNACKDSVSKEFKEVTDRVIFNFFRYYKSKDYLNYINLLYSVKDSVGLKHFVNSLQAFVVRGIYVINNVPVEGLSEDELLEYNRVFSEYEVSELAFILSELKRVDLGDIELNLMSFIYYNHNTSSNSDAVVVIPSNDVTKEKSFRSKEIEQKEDLESKKEVSNLLTANSEDANFSDISSIFNLEKVD